MAINGVNNSPLELMVSQDKNLADFTSSIKAGDTLKGRVVDLIQGENKAIINFKGFNVISEIPSGAQINKGDIINVSVSKVNDQIFMKLILPGNVLGSGVDMQATNQISPQQIIVMLNNLKVPVNEQNVFIAQKLLDYHIPVTAANIEEISISLNRYMEDKGVDVRSFNPQSPQTTKEIVVENMLKLNSEINNNLKSPVQTQAMSVSAKNLLLQNTNINEKLNNIMNTVSALSTNNDEISITSQNGTVTVSIKNPEQTLLKNIAVSALYSNTITTAEADVLINNTNLTQPVIVASGTIEINKTAGNTLEIKFNNIRESIEMVLKPGISGQAASTQASNNLRDSFNNKILGLNQETTTLSTVSTKPDLMNLLTPEFKSVLENLRNSVVLLNKAIFSPGDTNMTQNVKDIAMQIAKINASIIQLNSSFDEVTDKSSIKPAELANFKNDISSVLLTSGKLAEKIALPKDTSTFTILPKNFSDFQNDIKKFSNTLDNLSFLKNQNSDKSLVINAPAIDIESTIESLSFLKSRDVSLNNSGFIDTMGKYFKNDMKLNQNIESLILTFDKFNLVKNDASSDRAANSHISNISLLADKIKNLMQQISLSPTDSNLKQEIIQDQFKNFMDKAGLNTENKMSNAINSNSTTTLKTAVSQARETLKAELINLSDEIQAADTSKINNSQKQAISTMREKANDILTNMNAIQFINLKPVSYEMLYTQIPVLLNNKFFNGELQVWFRKGSLKENYEKSMPVNFVFMLNTSNMGNVKISLTVYKNDVECNVSAENEKAKQVLMRGKADFMKSMENINFNIKNFNIQLEKDSDSDSPSTADGYVSLGRINLEA